MLKHIAIEPDRNHILELWDQYEQGMGYSEHYYLSQLMLYRVFNDSMIFGGMWSIIKSIRVYDPYIMFQT